MLSFLFLAIVGISTWIIWGASGGRKKALEQERAVERAKAELRRLGLFEEDAYQEWLSQRIADREAVEKERIQIENFSSKALAKFVADPSSVLGGAEYLLGLAELQLPNGNPHFFWNTISRLDTMLFEGIPIKIFNIKKRAGPGCAVQQIETLEQEAARLAERLQGLVTRAECLETFKQEHALHRAYEKCELEGWRRRLTRPRRSSGLGLLIAWVSGHHDGEDHHDGGGYHDGGGDWGDSGGGSDGGGGH